MAHGFTLWFTGLSGAGKSTLAKLAQAELRRRGYRVELLDGDEVRQNLSKGLGFSKEDRDTNIRRIGYVCQLLARNGVIAIAAAISPYRSVREEVRAMHQRFFEVYVKCPLEKLIERDVKGLYKKALAGEIQSFTGISDPYEPPENPELVLETAEETVEQSLGKLLAALERAGLIERSSKLAAANVVTDDAISPHGGGKLVDLFEDERECDALRRYALKLKSIRLNARELSDLEMLACGAFSPLEGFMGEADYVSSRDTMRLSSGLLWPIPITLGIDQNQASEIKIGTDVALTTEQNVPVAILKLREIYKVDRKLEAEAVFGTADLAHPGVAALLATERFCVAGKIIMFSPIPGLPFSKYRLTPAQTRAIFRERGWQKIVAFQTRNPVHRAHEYIQKAALEICDGLLLHPLVGETKSDDVPAAVRIRTYEVLCENYYPKDRVVLAVMPAFMRYAGPKEAVLHAIVRRNYGCTHFIVGRDHAGVGNYYGTYDAQRIFARFAPEEIGITPLMFENTFFCRRCEAMASLKTCPHDDSSRLLLSGSKVREMLRRSEAPPPEYTRPEIAAILIEAMKKSA